MNDPVQHPEWEREALQKLLEGYRHDQRSDRRWKNFFRLSWLCLGALTLWYLFSNHSALNTAPSQEHIALIEIRGEIGTGAETDADAVVESLRAAFDDSGTKAVVLRFNSPGGSPVHAGIINDEIFRLKAKHQIPVYAVIEESCASAAYYIAVAADQIYVDKASIVGSIGVLMDGFGFNGLMEKIGVERRLLIAGQNKGFLDPFSPLLPPQRAHAQQLLDEIHQQFVEVVRKGRGERLKETSETFSGLFWTGEQSVKMGLADDMAGLNQVARDVVKIEEIVDYTRRENITDRLAKRFGVAIGEGAIRALRNIGSIH